MRKIWTALAYLCLAFLVELGLWGFHVFQVVSGWVAPDFDNSLVPLWMLLVVPFLIGLFVLAVENVPNKQ